jgi:hypothetical protein
MTRKARLWGATLGLVAALVVACAAEGCAVMSSGDCADKASCADLDGSTLPGPDGTLADGPTSLVEAGADQTALADAPVQDAPPGDVAVSDAAPPREAGATEAGPLEGGPADAGHVTSDACATTEDCTNGIDDNCDGKIDCEDPLCQPAFTCTPTVPAGWLGPVEFWQAASPATAPACDTGYSTPVDLRVGALTADPATCSCTCGATGQACSLPGGFFQQTNCGGSCAPVTPDPNGGCTPVPANSCGSEGSFLISGAATPTGGTCAPSPIVTHVPPATWPTDARVCSYAGAADAPGGCATGSCVRAPTGAAGTFGAESCVYSNATPAPTTCPTGYPTGPTLGYSDLDDTRKCDSTCACGGAPSAGACTGTVSLYGNFPDAGCTGSADTYTIGSACQCYGQSQCGADDQVILNNVPGFVRAVYTVTPGTCATPAAPASIGAAALSGPFTVCCR